jgi:DNA-binding NtrC family response regulator
MEVFVKRRWVGNVRELENVVMQGILFSVTDEIRPQNIDLAEGNTTACPAENALTHLPYKEAKEKILVRFNREYLCGLLAENRGNVFPCGPAVRPGAPGPAADHAPL